MCKNTFVMMLDDRITGSGRPSRRFWRTMVFRIALCSLVATVAAFAATGAITIPSSTATGIGLAAAANYQVAQDSQWKDYEDVVIAAALNGVAKAAANNGQALTAASYTSVVNQLRTWLNSHSPQNPVFADEAACLRFAIDALVPILNSSPASPFLATSLDGLENLKLTQLENPLDPNRQYPADMGLSSVSAHVYQFIADRVQEASDLAHNDPQYAAAISPVLVDLLGLDSTATYAQIQSLYPNATPTLPAPNADGSFTVNPQDLITQYQSIIDGVQSAIDGTLSALESQLSTSAQISPETRSTGRSAFNSASNSQSLSVCSPASNVGSGSTILIIADYCTVSGGTSSGTGNTADASAKSAISGLSKLVGLSDPVLATQISSVGGAVVQAGEAIGQLANLSASTSSIVGDLVTGLGVLGPVGAIAGAGVDIFSSLFSGSSANPNAAVLAQIQKLSQQIARLQTDMDNQFKQVDATLKTILTTLTQNFAQIDYQLGVLNGDVNAIQEGLLDVQTQLNQLAVYSLAYAQTQEYETLVQYLNGCLNYQTIHNGADIGLTLYDTCENELFTWANNDVTDQLWAGVQQPDYSTGNIYNIFLNSSVTGVCSGCASPFSTDVNYLAQFPAQNLDLPALASVRLPNPEMWTLVARAYLQLAREWPQYAVTINSVHFNDLIQVGTSLQQAIHNANSTGSGAAIVTNQSLFNAMVNKYNAGVPTLQSALQGDVNSYISNPSNGITNSAGITLNLWAGGANQHTSWRPTIGSIQFCDGSGTSLATPGNMLAAVPDLFAFSQGYLGYGELSICISGAQWVGSRLVYPLGVGSAGSGAPLECSPSSTNILDASPECVPIWAGNVPNPNDPGNPNDTVPSWNFVPAETQTLSRVALTVDVRFNGAPVLSVAGTSQQDILNSDVTYLCGAPPSESYYDSNCYLNRVLGPYSYLLAQPNVFPQVQTTTDLGVAVSQNWTSNLMLQQLISSLPQLTTYPQAEVIDNISAQLDGAAASHQKQIYGNIANAFGAVTPIQTAGQSLTGTKLLAEAYANFGLPGLLQTNDNLHGLLYGSGSILDAPSVQSDFTTYNSSSISDTTDNKVNDEISLLSSRSASLATAFTGELGQIQQSGTPDSLAQIDATLEDLQAFENLKNANALSACTYQLSSPSSSVALSGGSVTLTVNSVSGCLLNPSTNASWLTVSSVPLGSGQFQITISATSDANGTPRAGTVIVGDQTYSVFQGIITSDKIGAYNAGYWVVDQNGNFAWDGTSIDRLVYWSLGQGGEIPVYGDWNGDGRMKIGLYINGIWLLDYNGNGLWDGANVDKMVYFGGPGYIPVVGDWNGSGTTKIGVYQNGTWLLDYNGNFQWDGPGVDQMVYFGGPGYTPVLGDWNGSGTTKIGVYQNGTWLLDYNGNFQWDGATTDKLVYFGGPGYTPLVGDWNGSGTTKIGAYQNGLWLLDYNGNFQWDGTSTDKLVFFGGTGYTPVVGDWNGSGTTKIAAYLNGLWVIDVNGNFVWDPPTDQVVFFGGTGWTPIAGKW